jgi:hypothetical protein
MSNCDFVAGRSLIDLLASRLALRAPALGAATALTRPSQRREFIAGIAGAVAWRAVARAQPAAMPLIGYLGADDDNKIRTVPFLRGLKESGCVEGQNVAVE